MDDATEETFEQGLCGVGRPSPPLGVRRWLLPTDERPPLAYWTE